MLRDRNADRATRRNTVTTRPKKLSRQRLARLYKSVTRRIPKTLAILAK